ncbi:DUF2281 domain-containing protein [Calothrix sp. 336/3]|uniref:DUF2281 domain-containing protein n=1 Tax=Calothrix sp. 336/3 TaxID=1337936 RepID=UPI0004E2B1CF|nr:DUF2281 domain-containing protein [Calothrix sp. 336/3]AKG20918.1 hypothetical protein IJ00_06050 [Calothrix sp. 336/3]
MNPTDNYPAEDRSSADLVSVIELQQKLNDLLQQLSPERLQVLADFAAYLANAESETATQELLEIPGLLKRVKQNQATPKAQYTSWRSLRSDV